MTNRREEKDLSASDLNTLRVMFRDVRCVIVDEVSATFSDLLGQADRRVREIKPSLMTEPFGGFDVIMCRDSSLRYVPVRFTNGRVAAVVFTTQMCSRDTICLTSV